LNAKSRVFSHLTSNNISGLEDFLTDRIRELSFSAQEYEKLTLLIGCFPSLETGAKIKLINAVVSGAAKLSKLYQSSKEVAQEALESMTILAYATVLAAEKDKPAVAGNTKKGRGENLDWNHNKIVLAESLLGICTSPALPRLYQTYSDLENLVG
jgi:hypothetical protein